MRKRPKEEIVKIFLTKVHQEKRPTRGTSPLTQPVLAPLLPKEDVEIFIMQLSDSGNGFNLPVGRDESSVVIVTPSNPEVHTRVVHKPKGEY